MASVPTSMSKAKSGALSSASSEKMTKPKRSTFSLQSNSQIFKSWISWRIAFSVFLTIVIVQTAVLNFSIKDIQRDKLQEIETIVKNSMLTSLEPAFISPFSSPISDENANKLISKTIISGFTTYANEVDPLSNNSERLIPIKNYGSPMALNNLMRDNLRRTFRSANGNYYEFILRNVDLGRNYTIAVRADSSNVQREVQSYVIQTVVIMMLMAAFTTTVLMITIGHWLLEPILFMRRNLIEASKNPENPDIEESPFNPNDEIGSAIQIAQKLIRENAKNITQVKSSAESKINRLAYYDTLTGLPNRTLFLQEVAKAMQTIDGKEPKQFAVIAVDLDHFKDINDSMGHNVGDAILRGVGNRLRASMPDDVVVSRAGEDEFAVMLPLKSVTHTPRDAAEKIAAIIREEPFKVFNEEFQVRASIGVSAFPRDGVSSDQVIKNADIALNRAKEAGRNTIKEYSEDFDRAVQARFQMLRDLRDAMEQDQLVLNYQPQLDLNTGKIIGAEALLRWWKPNNSKAGGTFISPGDFIPIAEQSGLIVPIGEWVLRRAVADAKEWNEKHGLDTRIAVNVSPAQFSQGNLVDLVKKVLKENKLPAQKLELEVTESVFMDDITHTIQTLKDLHDVGVELAIDDFGTGYSSLSYLRQFPIDRLKIDQSFIRNALNDQDDASIAKTIIALGHSLNLKVIAEGVETTEHENFLIREGCDEVQGFRYSKAIPNDKFIEFCKNYNGDLKSFSTTNS